MSLSEWFTCPSVYGYHYSLWRLFFSFWLRFLFFTLKTIVSNIFLIATCRVDLFVVDVKYFHQWTCLFVCFLEKCLISVIMENIRTFSFK